ncbi:hypothetical protein ANN_07957 [Periplaneta americana]|uniref:Uncharacterized protein n=1 Tax=Periplaneta americana TaxID=6978 RepID=A0ABQ8T043_PERAM|nr:hypothetical protein ANN_07957 [Periplaneta americana]
MEGRETNHSGTGDRYIIPYGSSRQHAVKWVKCKKCIGICTVMQKGETESIHASSHGCTPVHLLSTSARLVKVVAVTLSTGRPAQGAHPAEHPVATHPQADHAPYQSIVLTYGGHGTCAQVARSVLLFYCLAYRGRADKAGFQSPYGTMDNGMMFEKHIKNILAGPDSNENLWLKTKQKPVEFEIRRRKWGWLGHTLRRPPDDPTRKALDWNPQGSRGIGRPKITWKRTVLTEAKTMGKTWSEIKAFARNRVNYLNRIRTHGRAQPRARVPTANPTPRHATPAGGLFALFKIHQYKHRCHGMERNGIYGGGTMTQHYDLLRSIALTLKLDEFPNPTG